ncbi:hypothetical protein M409DRAFT_67094 [Zasmidium cellare ATCC 36951]|uniref:NADP-dependent oxidoreductase domain-containing protein n=1 Tax=Zasmidium cellare ATCC 36951 TaxID=1080233 RepID=A0A6A6CF99_ZASCE|nr:uncharacterized protein M409DRAFT_67094 [Zasmidium cellare ATCC 36951]KAF2165741.1 hypothetical protein M409DRAFT_67094 [Zasmidium cellare ATCC 36951]
MPSTLPTRQLGKNGPSVPAIGLGLMGLSMHYGPAPKDEERFKFLDRAIELGATFWDTADMYGDSETVLGNYFARTGTRDKIFLATKFGFEKGSINNINSSAEYLKQACDESLKSLQTDYIDLYYMHRVNPRTPIEETMRGLIEYGPSELSIETPAGTDLLATCRDLGVAVVAYSPLGRGLLGGAQDFSAEGDWRGMFPRFTGEVFSANQRVVQQLGALVRGKGCTTAQLCLAWVLAQEGVVPIPGTKKVKYLEENVAAAAVGVSAEEEREVRRIVEGVQGLRVPEGFLYQCFVDTDEEK